MHLFQFDNCSFPLLCDPKFQTAVHGAGEEPRRLIDRYIGVINAVLAARPAGSTFAIHLCRGKIAANGLERADTITWPTWPLSAWMSMLFFSNMIRRAPAISAPSDTSQRHGRRSGPWVLEDARTGIGGELEKAAERRREIHLPRSRVPVATMRLWEQLPGRSAHHRR